MSDEGEKEILYSDRSRSQVLLEERIQSGRRWSRCMGSFFLSVVIIIWVASAVLIQAIFTDSDQNFAKPLFLTYYSTSFFTLYLVPLLYKYITLRWKAGKDSRDLISSSMDQDETVTQDIGTQIKAAEDLKNLKHDVRNIVWLSLTFCMLWFAANYFYNYGLLYATITSSVVLSNTSPIWVYVLSLMCCLPKAVREDFSWIKFVMILVSLAGFGLIAWQDDSSSQSAKPLVGDILSIVSAMCYALYAVYLKVKVPEEYESEFKFTYFLGFVGLINDVLLLPLFPLFNYTGLEVFEWPNGKTLMFLTINAFFGTFVSDYCWARSVVLLGPLITTLGITLTFPISYLYDRTQKQGNFSAIYFLGSFFIFLAFFVVVLKDYLDGLKKDKEKRRQYQVSRQRQEDNQSLLDTQGDM